MKYCKQSKRKKPNQKKKKPHIHGICLYISQTKMKVKSKFNRQMITETFKKDMPTTHLLKEHLFTTQCKNKEKNTILIHISSIA